MENLKRSKLAKISKMKLKMDAKCIQNVSELYVKEIKSVQNAKNSQQESDTCDI